MQGYTEREVNDAERARYGGEEWPGTGMTKGELIDQMERLLVYTQGQTYNWDSDYGALVFATVARSGRTFEGICALLRAGLAVQAGMLTRSLFEDVVVGHWLVYNEADTEWIVEKFLRQREAIGLHQRKLHRETSSAMAVPLPIADDAEDRAQALIEEFGKEAQRDWWNPGRKGRGFGREVSIREIVGKLEDAAAEGRMFHPRFAGGEQPLLRRTELVINKWLTQCIHHTTVGLPFTPTGSGKGKVEIPDDPTFMVAFSSTWMFAQQVYLIHDVTGRGGKDFEALFWNALIAFAEVTGPPDERHKLEAQLGSIISEFEEETGQRFDESMYDDD